jgi:hypothetical protein
VKPVVTEVSSKNSTTACYTFSIEVTMHNTQGCPVPQLDDVDPGCESVCSLVSNCTCRCHTLGNISANGYCSRHYMLRWCTCH